MGKSHLKRLNTPVTWRVKRKGIIFITRPMPGPHRMGDSIPLNIVMRDMLRRGATTSEVKYILQNKNILINGVRRKDIKFPVGLFDIVEIKETKELFRVMLDKKGKICLMATDKPDAEIRLGKIRNKTQVKGKIQLNLWDGINILTEKDEYQIGETLILGVPKNEIKGKIKFDKKSFVYLIGGKHIGEIGVVEDIKGKNITYKLKDGVFETLKDYAFAVGEDKPLIKTSK